MVNAVFRILSIEEVCDILLNRGADDALLVSTMDGCSKAGSGVSASSRFRSKPPNEVSIAWQIAAPQALSFAECFADSRSERIANDPSC